MTVAEKVYWKSSALSALQVNILNKLVYFLKDEENRKSLRRRHKYHTQVQMQMAITKREWCDFFVWSNSGFYLERIHFDSDLWKSYEDTLTEGFFKYIVPSIVPCSS